ncbi:PAS domain-containing sensor histidine kinase [Fibrella forsythiae]|uniref:histidine kinase n=1 Tax=Fibrella forsythiae TaxID=2817061 RepID=A0ABS3JFU5_9BACT|nr:PAS domain S-box protein [Fibrella forsythiae]MBO0948881.1 PAS domain S-box protein [Fibrella forsythiae]
MHNGDKLIPDNKALNQRLDAYSALRAANLGIWEVNTEEATIYYDDRCRELLGLPVDRAMPLDEFLNRINPAEAREARLAIDGAMNGQMRGQYDYTFRPLGTGIQLARLVRFIGQAQVDEQGKHARLVGIAQDITTTITQQQVADSEARFRTMVEQAPVAMCLFSGPQFVVTLANERMLEFWGRKREQVLSKPVFEALPEVVGQGFSELLNGVYRTGERFVAKERAVLLERNGQVERTYIDFVYEAFYEADGTISGVTAACIEVTEQVNARHIVEENEAKLRVLIEEAPVATCLFVGRELLIELANKPMLDFWGKGSSALGKPLAQALPELIDQPFLKILDDIFTTGEAYHSTAAPADLVVDGVLSTYYFDFTYKPIRTKTGEVYAIMNMAVDVTEQVLSRNRLVESEAYFRQLSDNVPAMIWTTKPDGYCDYLNKQWYDFTGQTKSEAEGYGWLDGTHPEDAVQAGQLFIDANTRQVPFSALYRLRKKEGNYRWVIDQGHPRFDSNGVYQGMVGTVVDVHEQKLAEEERQKLVTLMEASHEFVGLADKDGFIQYGNPVARQLLGWTSMEGKTILDCVYPDDRDQARELLAELVDKGHISHEIRFLNERTGEPFWLQWNGVAIKNATTGELISTGTVSPDITERRKIAQELEASEAKLRSLIASAPAGMGLFVGRDLVVEMPNQVFIDIVGKGPDIVGKPLREVMPELDSQPFLQILDEVYTSGKMYQSFGAQVNIVQRGVMTHNFYNITYSPLLDVNGEVYAILDIAIDVTEQIKAQKRLEESELFARSIIENSPVAKAVFVGEFMIIKTVNERMLDMMGRDASIIGQPFTVAMPELQQTPMMERLLHVLTTGETFYQPEEKIDLVRFGKPYTGYFNYVYKALSHTNGERYGVLATATEVTDQVVARHKIEESEKQFRALLEAIPAIAWTNSPTGEITFCNQRLFDYMGLDSHQLLTIDWQMVIHPDDLAHSMALYRQALTSGQDYVAENRYRRADGMYRWHLNRALPLRDELGQITKWVGTATDIHEQKQQEAELERQVAARTQQLNASIQDLQRSNDNLQQFAYIASHDLQEPLRKIQAFSTLLSTGYADQLGEGTDYLTRMQAAASRMSTLIRDLLTYSRISTRQEESAPVALERVVQHALLDLELVIEESSATIEVAQLPIIQGDETQLNQLMQNLLSNALKFRRQDADGQWISPVIRVSARHIRIDDLPASVKPARKTRAYYQIDVADNGIGFDEKYANRIFQVFQRLHGKGEFAGTGIGLAICEKVAANHGGAITAMGKPGEGAAFSVYFPIPD